MKETQNIIFILNLNNIRQTFRRVKLKRILTNLIQIDFTSNVV